MWRAENLVFYVALAMKADQHKPLRALEYILALSAENCLNRLTLNEVRVDGRVSNLTIKNWVRQLTKSNSTFGTQSNPKILCDDLLDNLTDYLIALSEEPHLGDSVDVEFVRNNPFREFMLANNKLSIKQLESRRPFETIGDSFMSVGAFYDRYLYVRQTSDPGDVKYYALGLLEFHAQNFNSVYSKFFTLIHSRSDPGKVTRIVTALAGDVISSKDVLLCIACLDTPDDINEVVVGTFLDEISSRIYPPRTVSAGVLRNQMIFSRIQSIRTINLKKVAGDCYNGVAFIKDADHSTAISPVFMVPLREDVNSLPYSLFASRKTEDQITEILRKYKDVSVMENDARAMAVFLGQERSNISG